MTKVKLFTHTDLDGVSCAVVAGSVFGIGNVDVTYCTYNNMNQLITEFVEQEAVNGFENSQYDAVYITDLNIDSVLFDAIDTFLMTGKMYVFDHHVTDVECDYKNFVVKKTDDDGLLTCGTSLFAKHLIDNVVLKSQERFIDTLTIYSSFVRMYDTYDFRNNPAFAEYAEYVERLNKVCHMYTKEEFVDKMVDRIINFKPLISDEDTAISNILDRIEKEYIDNIIDEITVLENRVIAFADKYASSIGYRITSLYPDKYACIINISKGAVSLRSAKDSLIDVSAIARRHGGGGHFNAAGFSLKIDRLNKIKNFIACECDNVVSTDDFKI